MDSRLDDLIAAAAPSVSPRTDALRRDLAAVVADSEAAAGTGPRRHVRRMAAAGLFALAATGLGTTASAAGLLPWFENPIAVHQRHTGSAGEDCEWTFAARAFNDEAHPVGTAERAATMAAAQHFLADFDVSGISVPQAVSDYQAAQDALDVPPGERPPQDDPKEVAFLAVTAELNDRLEAELTAHGLSPYAVSVAGATDCTDPDDSE